MSWINNITLYINFLKIFTIWKSSSIYLIIYIVILKMLNLGIFWVFNLVFMGCSSFINFVSKPIKFSSVLNITVNCLIAVAICCRSVTSTPVRSAMSKGEGMAYEEMQAFWAKNRALNRPLSPTLTTQKLVILTVALFFIYSVDICKLSIYTLLVFVP